MTYWNAIEYCSLSEPIRNQKQRAGYQHEVESAIIYASSGFEVSFIRGLALSPLDIVHRNIRSEKRFSYIQDSLERGFVKQRLNFVLLTAQIR